jgi:hypothetical protein
MFAASLDTSDPEIFMAIPRSAFLRAGESLTPSPVLHLMFRTHNELILGESLHANNMTKSLRTFDFMFMVRIGTEEIITNIADQFLVCV